MQPAYFLVAHGSRDPRPQAALTQLAVLVAKRLAASMDGNSSQQMPAVATGTLELAPISLSEQIQQFADTLQARGCHQIQVVPLFLLPGVHVCEDLPAEVAAAQTALGTEVSLRLLPHLGSHNRLAPLLLQQQTQAEAWILLSHGSRRAGSQVPVEELAMQLNAVPAFWSISPSLETQVSRLIERGCRQIGILPYFLFAGGLTDAIVAQVEAFSVQMPAVEFYVAEPLGVSWELADLIVDLIIQNQPVLLP